MTRFIKILIFYFVTGLALLVYSFCTRAIFDFDKVFNFWLQATPFVILSFFLKIDRPRKKSVYLYIAILILLILGFGLYTNYIKNKNFKDKYWKEKPLEILNIGGLGPRSDFVFTGSCDHIPEGFGFERKTIQGWEIWVPREDEFILINKPDQYDFVYVMNRGNWVCLYKLKE